MAQDFYPFVGDGDDVQTDVTVVRHPARIAVYDDAAAAPRVVVVEPKDVRSYLEEITLQVTQLAQQQGSTIPFMVIREIVENFIHAFFMEPTISILDRGSTIRFSDQGPGIREKDRALQYGTTSATEEMRRYIRGVGSGLPYVQQYMVDKGGSLSIDDNMQGGTVVTISCAPPAAAQPSAPVVAQPQQATQPQATWPQQGWGAAPATGTWWPQAPQAPQAYPWPQAPQTPQAPQGAWPQQQAWGQAPAPWPQAVPTMPQPPVAPEPAPPGTVSVALSERGWQIISWLREHESVGPSDLHRALGGSQPTWSRELASLEEKGILKKDGQKRRLTPIGQTLL